MPGMFARVAVLAGEAQRYLTLPQTSITYNPYGATVFIAQQKPGGTDKEVIAQQSFVTLGLTRGDQVAVLKGVKEGDLVVTSGQLKLINGTPLVINNSAQPVNDSDPSPQEQ
jgi:membrane fusion protein (multidrug efflux system)